MKIVDLRTPASPAPIFDDAEDRLAYEGFIGALDANLGRPVWAERAMLASAAGLRPTRWSAAVRRLEERGLISRSAGPPTDAGRRTRIYWIYALPK